MKTRETEPKLSVLNIFPSNKQVDQE
jgi:hypothetical protein